MRLYFLTILCGALLAESAGATGDFRALIRRDLRVTVVYPGPPGQPDHWQRSELYTRGGFMTSNFVARNSESVNTAILRGTAPAEVVAFLKRTLNEQHIGQQRACWSDRDPRFSGSDELVWNGRGGREHRFTVTYAREPAAGLPKCPEATEKILEALDILYDVVVATGELIVDSD